jgi:hypothetical protein
MRRTIVLLLFATLASATAVAEPALRPSIGLAAPPRAGDAICPIPVVDQDFDAGALATGSPVADFTLYRSDGVPASLRSLLGAGRPALLVAGSISCPVFRSSLAALNDLAARYGDRVAILIVYVLEPHPVVDVSPYFGVENTTSQNRYADILVRQPRTYGERRALVDSLRARFAVTPQIVIDGPCNEWWSAYGRAPNNAVLVDADGRVAAYHPWFDREPLDMSASIDSLLGVERPRNDVPGIGRFELAVAGALDAVGAPGTPFTFLVDVINPTSSTLRLAVDRVASELPDGWTTATCTDVCQPPRVASDMVKLRPGATLIVAIHLFSDSLSVGAGRVTIRLTNADSSANLAEITATARTVAQVASVPREQSTRGAPDSPPLVYDLLGRCVGRGVDGLARGRYFVVRDGEVIAIVID